MTRYTFSFSLLAEVSRLERPLLAGKCGFFFTYTCNHSCYTIYVIFLPRILEFFLALWGFYSQVYDHFLTNANRSVFLLFSLSRELSPFLLHEHVLSLLVSKLFILSLHSLYKFHVSCFAFSHFNSLPPASLSLLLHFNYGYLTRSRSTCIKCPSGINLLLVLKPRLFGRIFYL